MPPEKWGGLQATNIAHAGALSAVWSEAGQPGRSEAAGPLSAPGFVLLRDKSSSIGASWRPSRVRPPRGLSPSQTESPKGREHRVAGGGGVSDPSLIVRRNATSTAAYLSSTHLSGLAFDKPQDFFLFFLFLFYMFSFLFLFSQRQ